MKALVVLVPKMLFSGRRSLVGGGVRSTHEFDCTSIQPWDAAHLTPSPPSPSISTMRASGASECGEPAARDAVIVPWPWSSRILWSVQPVVTAFAGGIGVSEQLVPPSKN